MSDTGTVKEAISQFIISTTPPQQPTQKSKYRKSTHIVNFQISNLTSSETVLDIKGIGSLREIFISSPQKINPYLVIDGEDALRSINSWDQLAQITLYTTTIIAQKNGNDFVLSFNKINFTKSLFLKISFDTKSTISRAFGVYDLCEMI